MGSYTRQELEGFMVAARKSMATIFRMPLLKMQRLTMTDRGVRGPQWVSRTTFPAPEEDDVRSLLLDAIKDLGDGNEEFDIPEIANVPVQWVGVRSGVGKNAPEPSEMSEHEKFDALMAETKSDMTIMYTYGGGHIMNGPALRRPTAAALCKLTGARCVIVQHRLAPQDPFPCQHLDALLAYLT